MSRRYRVGWVRRAINRYAARQIKAGKLADNMYLLTTLGRKSGQERTTPVTLARVDGKRYLVAPFGNVGWVYNIRAAGLADLSRGGKTEEVTVVELDAETAAPILKKYVEDVSVARPYFEAGKDSPLEDFVSEAEKHPVFQIS